MNVYDIITRYKSALYVENIKSDAARYLAWIMDELFDRLRLQVKYLKNLSDYHSGLRDEVQILFGEYSF